MKNRILSAALGIFSVLVALTSCEKEGTRRFEGGYSFKTGGQLTVVRESKVQTEDDDVTFTHRLSAESGQMNIVATGGKSMAVTMNIIGGDLLVFDAEVDGKALVLSPLKRVISISDGAVSAKLDVTVSGRGEKYDDVVIFTLDYAGGGSNSLYEYTIESSSVKCVAKVND